MKNVFSKLLFISFFLVGAAAVNAANIQPQYRVVGFEGKNITPSDPKRAESIDLKHSILARSFVRSESEVVKPGIGLVLSRANRPNPFAQTGFTQKGLTKTGLTKTKTFRKGLNKLGAAAGKEND